MDFSARQIAEYLGGEIEGDGDVRVNSFSKIEEGSKGSLTFLANPKYTHFIYDTEASAILVETDFKPEKPLSATLIRVPNPYDALARLMVMYEDATRRRKSGIDSKAHVAGTAQIGKDAYVGAFAYVGENAEIGEGAEIFPYAYIGDGCKIGKNTVVNPHVSVYHDCRIGANCVLHSGVVIGADGFGFAPTETGYEKIPQIGIVIIEDDVEIGANTCVDRATMGATIIRRGVKLDNLIQIAHNDEIGSHTVMAAQSGVAGSTKVGEWCMFGGQVGVAGHIAVGDKVRVGAQSGIPGHVKPGSDIMGTPSMPLKAFMRMAAVQSKLPDMYKKMAQLEKGLEQLKEKLKD